MRNASQIDAVEMLLCALYEGTASHGPWVCDHEVEQELGDLSYDKPLDVIVPYQYALLTLASARACATTREATLAVRSAADTLLALLDMRDWLAQRNRPPSAECGIPAQEMHP